MTEKEVLMKRLMTLLISGALIAGSAGLATAQQSQTPQRSDNDSVKQTTKDVGHDTKRAAKATGKKVKNTTKKVVNKGAKATRKASEKVEDKTETKK
jgi:gas vesicle protein